MTPRHFDQELQELTRGIQGMAVLVERMVELTRAAQTDRSDAGMDEAAELDQQVDERELQLDQFCIDLLALRAPMAADLRIVTGAIKIIPELERIADHCGNVLRRAKLLNAQEALPLGDAPDRMARETQAMVRGAVEAFLGRSATQARNVIQADDVVDGLYQEVYKDLLRRMLADPLCIERASHWILIIKNWERIADQATNIAEEVLFILEGRNVKHAYLQSRS